MEPSSPPLLKHQGKLLFSKRLYNFVDENFTVCCVVLFQTLGTALFSYGVLTGLNGNFGILPQLQGPFQSVWIPMILFLMIFWGARFSKSHFNPAVTLAFTIKRYKPINWRLALVYVASEFLGAMFGTFIAWQVNPMTDGAPWPSIVTQYKFVLFALRGEVIGTAMLVFFIMVANTPETNPCQSQLEGCAFIPLILICARQYSYRLQGLNPVFGVVFQLFYCIYRGNWGTWAYVWVTFLGPFIGSVLGVLAFQFVYRKFLRHYLKRTELRYKKISLRDVELF